MARYLEIAAGAKRGLNWDAYRDTADPSKGVEKYDFRQLPMRGVWDNTYDGAYSEHFIEHLTADEGMAFFKKCIEYLSQAEQYALSGLHTSLSINSYQTKN